MISERKFATSFGSFWSSITPLMEEYVQEINRNPSRYAKPVSSSGAGNMSAVFSEIAFELFTEAIEKGHRTIAKFQPKKVQLRSRHTIATFLRKQQSEHKFTKDNKEEITQLAKNLLDFFVARAYTSLLIRPIFKGCGIVNECEGDLRNPKLLVEVKSVQRNISSADLRQILIYLALMHADSTDVSPTVLILNPRLGVIKTIDSRRFAIEISGMDLYTLLDEIILYMSDLSNVLLPDLNTDFRGK